MSTPFAGYRSHSLSRIGAMSTRVSPNLAITAALFFMLVLVWTVPKPHLTTFHIASAAVTEVEVDTDAVRKITPQHPLGVVSNVSLLGSPPRLADVQNSTLGFQKIFILSMPDRSDKRDALILSAYMTGLDIEFIDGMPGESVSPKAVPQKWVKGGNIGDIGCWRGHMDIYQRMVRDRIQTALVMEDDVDWDVMIKAQMTEFARGTRYLLNTTTTNEPHSPYGDGWDLLITGHCGIGTRDKEDQDYWVSNDDPTVGPPPSHRYGQRPNLKPAALSGKHTRHVFSPEGFTCTASYGVSLPGAARIIYDQAVLPNGKAIDLGLSGMCWKRNYRRSSCLGAWPAITGVHRPAGDMGKDSDRVSVGSGKMRKKAESPELVFPVRLNLESLLKGETVVKAQYPKHAILQEIDTSTLQIPRGGPVHIEASEYDGIMIEMETSSSSASAAAPAKTEQAKPARVKERKR